MRKQKTTIISTYKDKNITNSFDRKRNEYLFQRYKHKIESNLLRKAIKKSVKKPKILDVACGTGRMLPEVFNITKDVEYFGLDTSKEMVNHLKDKVKKLDKKVKITLGDATKIKFKENTFDIVFTYHLLWHLPKKEQEVIIGEMIRVTKKGGLIIFDILNKSFYFEKIKKILGKRKTEGIYKINIKEVKEIIQRRDFEIEKLCDAPIRNDYFYKKFNIINKLRRILPMNMFHMVYITLRK